MSLALGFRCSGNVKAQFANTLSSIAYLRKTKAVFRGGKCPDTERTNLSAHI